MDLNFTGELINNQKGQTSNKTGSIDKNWAEKSPKESRIWLHHHKFWNRIYSVSKVNGQARGHNEPIDYTEHIDARSLVLQQLNQNHWGSSSVDHESLKQNFSTTHLIVWEISSWTIMDDWYPSTELLVWLKSLSVMVATQAVNQTLRPLVYAGQSDHMPACKVEMVALLPWKWFCSVMITSCLIICLYVNRV